jgi:hypothetical protein
VKQSALAGVDMTTIPAQESASGDRPEGAAMQWDALRQPPRAEDLDLRDRTFKWIATLPREVRPIETGQTYPRIVNRICDLWPSCEYTRLYFQSLLIDRRAGRRGFPLAVRQELEALQQYYFVNHSGLPAILWNAVPQRQPKIPRRVLARHADSDEIDIPPL